jgi:hypothetical protein
MLRRVHFVIRHRCIVFALLREVKTSSGKIFSVRFTELSVIF